MKTTIDLPDPLYRRLKVRAAESGVTIRELVVNGIQRELSGDIRRHIEDSTKEEEQERHSFIDEKGWPVLKRPSRKRTVVTNDFVNRLREVEGV
mgnify:CR=1 FL=1